MAFKDKKEKAPTAWEDVSVKQTLPKRGVCINIDGAEGTGKSSLALTIARLGPVAYEDIDQSLDRARRPDMPKGRQFKVRKITTVYSGGMSEEKIKNTCLPAWKQIKNSSLEAAEKWATGVIVDSGTEAWEVLRLGMFGTLTPRGRTDSLYGPVNAEFRNWIRRLHRVHGKHLVLVNQMKDQWGKNKKSGESERTGKLERVGFKELGYLADMTLETFKEKGEFKVRIVTCKLAPNGPSMEGQVMEDDDVDLIKILATVTDTEEGDWLK